MSDEQKGSKEKNKERGEKREGGEKRRRGYCHNIQATSYSVTRKH